MKTTVTRCDEVRELLDIHLDGDLPQTVSSKLERHLLRCPTCAYEARTLEQTRALLRQTVVPAETTASFRERTAARLHDSLAAHLRPLPSAPARQWSLSFTDEDAPTR